jgi:cytochrome c nitrite reductase small subunit
MTPAASPTRSPRRLGLSLAGAFAVTLGALGGLGAFTFGYGEGWAYLGNDPASCANCHVMQDHYDSFIQSSHHDVATCNDCHLSHHPIGKWITKADNGFFHSLAFTTGDFPDPLRIKPRNRRVTQAACLHCHDEFVHALHVPADAASSVQCVHCHRDVGHALR